MHCAQLFLFPPLNPRISCTTIACNASIYCSSCAQMAIGGWDAVDYELYDLNATKIPPHNKVAIQFSLNSHSTASRHLLAPLNFSMFECYKSKRELIWFRHTHTHTRQCHSLDTFRQSFASRCVLTFSMNQRIRAHWCSFSGCRNFSLFHSAAAAATAAITFHISLCTRTSPMVKGKVNFIRQNGNNNHSTLDSFPFSFTYVICFTLRSFNVIHCNFNLLIGTS